MDYIIKLNKKKKQKRRYFTQETEDAIVKYNSSSSHKERDILYRDFIHYPLYKLTENIIHTFKFYNTKVENLEDLQHEIITFLLSKLNYFKPEHGAKAYSYFGTITKRWLITYDTINYKDKNRNISINSIINSNQDSDNVSNNIMRNLEENTSNFDEDFHHESYLVGTKYSRNQRLSSFIDEYVCYCTVNIYTLFPKIKDAKIADAVLELFRKRENIDIFNKKALYIYIREMVEAPTPKITKIANKLNDIFKDKYKFYLEHDYFPLKD